MDEKFNEYKEDHAKEHESLKEKILKHDFKLENHEKIFAQQSKVMWLFIGGMLTAAGAGFVALLLSKGN